MFEAGTLVYLTVVKPPSAPVFCHFWIISSIVLTVINTQQPISYKQIFVECAVILSISLHTPAIHRLLFRVRCYCSLLLLSFSPHTHRQERAQAQNPQRTSLQLPTPTIHRPSHAPSLPPEVRVSAVHKSARGYRLHPCLVPCSPLPEQLHDKYLLSSGTWPVRCVALPVHVQFYHRPPFPFLHLPCLPLSLPPPPLPPPLSLSPSIHPLSFCPPFCASFFIEHLLCSS